MVGNEEGNRYNSCLLSGLCIWPQCRSFIPPGVSLLTCRHSALEGQPRPHDADAEDQAAAEAAAPSGLHDQERGSEVSLARKADAASGAVLPDWLVHGIAAISDHGPEVVDGES